MPSRENGSRNKNVDASPRFTGRTLHSEDDLPHTSSSRHAPAAGQPSGRPSSPRQGVGGNHVKVVLPEMKRRNTENRAGPAPYPTFSKAHSREAVRSVDSVPLNATLTAAAANAAEADPAKSGRSRRRTAEVPSDIPHHGQAPPSPPLTTVEDSVLKRGGSNGSMRQTAVDARLHHARRKSADNDTLHSLRKAEEGASGLRTSPTRPSASSKSSLRSLFQGRSGLASGKKTPLTTTASRKSRSSADSDTTPQTHRRTPSRRDRPHDIETLSGVESPKIPKNQLASKGASRASSDGKGSPTNEVLTSYELDSDTGIRSDQPSHLALSPRPPPPPPPPAVDPAMRVDYLLQNGGLYNPVPRNFRSALWASDSSPISQHAPSKQHESRTRDLSAPFQPFNRLLDDYASVLSKQGSVAVATGYKPVAQTLTERLESVFARTMSPKSCECVICHSTTSGTLQGNPNTTWAEVFELVSGRTELPPWPPFTQSTSADLGMDMLSMQQQPPMQRLDIDVPEEYREHYVRQSMKTKQAVDKWLAGQPEDHHPAPQEVDDETMIFAMLTYLEPEQRRAFMALMRGWHTVPDTRAPTPAQGPDTNLEVLPKAGLALQRLYRLSKSPRNPESAIFLLRNRGLHGVMATLASVSQDEWGIILSGRFDDILLKRSPASDIGLSPARGHTTSAVLSDAPPPDIVPPSAAIISPSLASLPPRAASSSGNLRSRTSSDPILMDEEAEVAVLAEVEREIYLGMEALEDAFEALHSKAESVRNALLQRSSGLIIQSQGRHERAGTERPQARLGTPAVGGEQKSVQGGVWGARPGRKGGETPQPDDDDDDAMFDERSELAPDDSASNIGWREREKRSRYKKRRAGTNRRNERRTPAPVEEEDEDEFSRLRR